MLVLCSDGGNPMVALACSMRRIKMSDMSVHFHRLRVLEASAASHCHILAGGLNYRFMSWKSKGNAGS